MMSDYESIPATSSGTYRERSSSRSLRGSSLPSILKAPTPTFVTNRRSSRTRKLKFLNEADDSVLLKDFVREPSHDSVSTSSDYEFNEESYRVFYDQDGHKLIEVEVCPGKMMRVSPDTWKAHLEYRKYDNYSNETEKTDYTYSEASDFRDREIVPGVRIRPNLSRRPLHEYSSSSSSSKHYSSTPNQTTPFGLSYWFRSDNSGQDVIHQNEVSEFVTRKNVTLLGDGYNEYSGNGLDDPVEDRERTHVLKRNSFTQSNYLGNNNLDKARYNPMAWDYDETDYDFALSSRNHRSSSSNSMMGSIARYLTAMYTFVYHGMTSTLLLFKDLFSRYILRKDSSYPYGYSSTYSGSPRSYIRQQMYGTTQPGFLSRWWDQSLINQFYRKVTNRSRSYASAGYRQYADYGRSSRRCSLFWLLIPLLLLLGLWLFRAEKQNAFVSNEITAFKCKANHVRSQANTMWKTASAYGEKVFGQKLAPVGQVLQYLGWVLGTCFGAIAGLISSVFFALLSVCNILKDVFLHFWTVFVDLFADLVDNKDHISGSMFGFFTDVFNWIRSGASWVLHPFQWLLALFPYSGPTQNYPKLQAMTTSDSPDSTGLAFEWEGVKKRIEYLEKELQKSKEDRNVDRSAYRKELENYYKAFQKYQVSVNEALRRCTNKPARLLRSYLENQSDELKKWSSAIFMQKSDPNQQMDEKKLALLMSEYRNASKIQLAALQSEFSRFVQKYNSELSNLKTDISLANCDGMDVKDVPVTIIKRIIADEIKLHDADKTGKVDYALESAGGRVRSIKCTETYSYCYEYENVLFWSVCRESRKTGPEEAIRPGMAPGQCWAFVGSQGYLVLELSHSIFVNGFTMEHISKLLSPNGVIDSAPKKFSMWGLKTGMDPDPHLFGEYEYKDNNETYQYFPVNFYSSDPYKLVELTISSNHGNPNYTCLYRIRVHGDVSPANL